MDVCALHAGPHAVGPQALVELATGMMCPSLQTALTYSVVTNSHAAPPQVQRLHADALQLQHALSAATAREASLQDALAAAQRAASDAQAAAAGAERAAAAGRDAAAAADERWERECSERRRLEDRLEEVGGGWARRLCKLGVCHGGVRAG